MEEKDHEKHLALIGQFVNEKLIPHLEKIEERLGKNNGFLVGKRVLKNSDSLWRFLKMTLIFRTGYLGRNSVLHSPVPCTGQTSYGS